MSVCPLPGHRSLPASSLVNFRTLLRLFPSPTSNFKSYRCRRHCRRPRGRQGRRLREHPGQVKGTPVVRKSLSGNLCTLGLHNRRPSLDHRSRNRGSGDAPDLAPPTPLPVHPPKTILNKMFGNAPIHCVIGLSVCVCMCALGRSCQDLYVVNTTVRAEALQKLNVGLLIDCIGGDRSGGHGPRGKGDGRGWRDATTADESCRGSQSSQT
jgi:hypothetical protein